MKLPIYQLDAFTNRRFGGNPAAVVLLPDWLDDATMLAVARENNYSETAFVVPRGESFDLRWFTPQVEMDLCGHATLASAHVLFHHGHATGGEIVFRYSGGTLRVTRDGDLLALDFPSRPPARIPLDDAVAAALGDPPSELHGARDLLALAETQADVEDLSPDIDAIASLDTFAVIVTAPGNEHDFVSRFFAPRAGVPEDPVTGSAHCTLIPFWSARLGKKKMRAAQLSERGGQLYCEDHGERVTIAGHAVEYLCGEIEV